MSLDMDLLGEFDDRRGGVVDGSAHTPQLIELRLEVFQIKNLTTAYSLRLISSYNVNVSPGQFHRSGCLRRQERKRKRALVT
jgi:hypothetical protein